MTDLLIPRQGSVVDQKAPAADDARMWSVTTILDVIDKPALTYWAARQTALAALDTDYVRTRIDKEGEAETIKWLANARFRPNRDELAANDLGSAVHLAAQQYALSGQRPDPETLMAMIRSMPSGVDLSNDGARGELRTVETMLDRFDEWLDRFQPTYETAEVVVYNPTYGYAGTLDTIFTVCDADHGCVRMLGDYKTSREPRTRQGKPKTPYPETVLQLAAYRFAELAAVWPARRYEYYRRRYYLLGPAEQSLAVPVPDVDGAVCVFITPESCEAFPMRADRRAFDAFLYVLEVARWCLQDVRGAVGEPLVPPIREDN